MHTEPKVEHRDELNYAGINIRVPISEFGEVIPRLHGVVMGWLKERGIEPSGPPVIRYNVIDMEKLMDIDLGWIVGSPFEGDGQVQSKVLPEGNYATMVFTGIENAIPATYDLIKWARAHGLEWDRWDDPNGDAFRSRYELSLTNPADEPDPAKWETASYIKIAD